LKDLEANENVSFHELFNSLNMDENTYILSLRSKLKKPHISKNELP
jgi:hypothetical protein